MVAVQRELERAEGVKMYRAQGRMEQIHIFDRLPLEVEYLIQAYENLDRETKEEVSNA